jgi:hypothetical protein
MESKKADSSNFAPAQPEAQAAPKPTAPPPQNAWAKKPSIVPDASATAIVQTQPVQPQKHVSNGQPPYPRKNSQGRGSKRPSNAGMANSGSAPQQSKPITIPASAGPSSRSVSQLKFGVDGPDGSPKPPAAITSYAKVIAKTANAQPPAGKLKFGTVEQAETGSSVSTTSSASQAPANGSINAPQTLIVTLDYEVLTSIYRATLQRLRNSIKSKELERHLQSYKIRLMSLSLMALLILLPVIKSQLKVLDAILMHSRSQ